MKLLRVATCFLLGAFSLALTNCDTGEAIDSAEDLPFPLLMQRNNGISYHVVLMRVDRTIIQLAEGINPRWSPDGSKIAFWTNTPAGLNEIYLMNSDGSNLRNLTMSGSIYEARPVWAPIGSLIAFDEEALGSGKGVGLMNSDGTDRHFVPSGNSFNVPAWLPDGSSLLFQKVAGSRLAIHRVNSDGTEETALVSDTTRTLANGSISPNGTYLAYSRGDPSSGTFTALIIRELASGWEVVIPGAIIASLWSPQSDWVYCSETSLSGIAVVRVSPTGSVKQDLSRKPFGRTYNDVASSLSADGNWLAIVSDRSGSRLIYMMDAAGSNQLQITADPQLSSPFWQPM